MVEQLTTSQPFDLERTLRCGQGHRWLKDESDEGWYTAVFDSYWVRIRQLGGKHNPVQFDTNANTNAVEVKLRRHFRLDDPIEDIYADLSGRDAEMKALVERYQGLRVMRVDPWECLVFFILAGQRPIARTQRQMEAIAEAFSNGAPPVTNGRYIFPTPPTIMNAQSKGSDKLRALGLGLQKDKNIYRAAKVVDRTGNVAIAVASQLTGVADKTANCVTLFSLDWLGGFPVDTNIKWALDNLYGSVPGSRDNPPPARKWAQQRFGTYAGYASQFLFIHAYENKL